MRFIVSGTHQQAVEYARSVAMPPSAWRYVANRWTFRGVRLRPEDIIWTGTWWDRDDLLELHEQIDIQRAWTEGEPPPLVTLRVAGKPFRCDCGANVFAHVEGSLIYTCNGCSEAYEGS